MSWDNRNLHRSRLIVQDAMNNIEAADTLARNKEEVLAYLKITQERLRQGLEFVEKTIEDFTEKEKRKVELSIVTEIGTDDITGSFRKE